VHPSTRHLRERHGGAVTRSVSAFLRPSERSCPAGNVRGSPRRPRVPGVRTQGVNVALPMSSPATRSCMTSIRSLPCIATDGVSSGGPSPGHRATRSRQQSRGTRRPRAIHIYGLTRTTVQRRRRTPPAFSSARAAIKIATVTRLAFPVSGLVVTDRPVPLISRTTSGPGGKEFRPHLRFADVCCGSELVPTC
jgi:hypothetical protein